MSLSLDRGVARADASQVPRSPYMDLSYITVDSRACKCLFVSPSVEDVLGYLPEERIGLSGADLPHPAQVTAVHRLWLLALNTEFAGIVIRYHFRTKSGEIVPIASTSCLCGDICISTVALRNPDGERELHRESTAEECIDIDLEGNIRFLNWNTKLSHLRDQLAGPLPSISPVTPEPRVAMILNRYTLTLTILYVSSSMVLGLNPETTVGTSFLSYVVPSQRRRVETQVLHIKSFPSLLRLRFAWMVTAAQKSGLEQGQEPLPHSAQPAPEHPQASSFTSDLSAERTLCETPGANGQPGAARACEDPANSLTASDREELAAGGMRAVECEAQLWGSTDGIVCVIREADRGVVNTRESGVSPCQQIPPSG